MANGLRRGRCSAVVAVQLAASEAVRASLSGRCWTSDWPGPAAGATS